MRTDPPAGTDTPALPPDVKDRLHYWHGLWTRSALYHYLFGVVSVAASVISTSVEGNLAKAFSIVAAIATALIGFMHPERRYMKFVRAWRVLDVAAMRYQHGLIDKAALVDAVERGEGLIAEFEDKDDKTGGDGEQPKKDLPMTDPTTGLVTTTPPSPPVTPPPPSPAG